MFNIYINFCWWLDSNCGPLVFEATALPTEPQPLPTERISLLTAPIVVRLTLRCVVATWVDRSQLRKTDFAFSSLLCVPCHFPERITSKTTKNRDDVFHWIRENLSTDHFTPSIQLSNCARYAICRNGRHQSKKIHTKSFSQTNKMLSRSLKPLLWRLVPALDIFYKNMPNPDSLLFIFILFSIHWQI